MFCLGIIDSDDYLTEEECSKPRSVNDDSYDRYERYKQEEKERRSKRGERCKYYFCKNKIHTKSDYEKEFKRWKKVSEFWTTPEYNRFAECYNDIYNYETGIPEFMSAETCKDRKARMSERKWNAYVTTPSQTSNFSTPDNIRETPTPKSKSPSARATTKKCPKRTRRNKKTGNCEGPRSPKAKTSSATKATTKRCPKGTKRNKKTGNCEAKI